MPRRETTNTTRIARIAGITPHDAWVMYVCIRCAHHNLIKVGQTLLTENQAYDESEWKCEKCEYVHSRNSGLPNEDPRGNELPFSSWDDEYKLPGSVFSERFWRGFFRIAVADKQNYWKQCNTCGRVQPYHAFDRHVNWGPLERQMECRSCKAAINSRLNPLRTPQQLHESSSKRRAAELLIEGENENVDIDELFVKFGSRCFKTGKLLDKNERRTWNIDHVLPSKWLYPLNPKNAALLSFEANSAKSDKWPSDFYTNDELIRLARLIGADLALLSSRTPSINPRIDVDACVTRMLSVRGATDLSRRIDDIKKLLNDYNLVPQLSDTNKRLLGLA